MIAVWSCGIPSLCPGPGDDHLFLGWEVSRMKMRFLYGFFFSPGDAWRASCMLGKCSTTELYP
jgi:hypothetical protein